MNAKEMFTERDNQTLCVLRILGTLGVLFVGGAAVLGAAPFEVGAGVAAIITAIGGGVRLKGESVDTKS